jgi:hypothetical protein
MHVLPFWDSVSNRKFDILEFAICFQIAKTFRLLLSTRSTIAPYNCRHFAIRLRIGKAIIHICGSFLEMHNESNSHNLPSFFALLTFFYTILRFGFESQTPSITFCDSFSNRKQWPSGYGDPFYHRTKHLFQFCDDYSRYKRDTLHVAIGFRIAQSIPMIFTMISESQNSFSTIFRFGNR